MLIRIDVTQDDIDNGSHEGVDCPVALALLRVRPDAAWQVGRDVLFVRSDPARCDLLQCVGPLPADVRMFISRYDHGESVRPFSFDLDVPGDLLASLPAP